MVKKIVAIYFTLILFIFVYACQKCKTYDEMEPLKYKRISNINMYNVRTDPFDSTQLEPHTQPFENVEVLANPQIDIDSFGMKCTITHEIYAKIQESFNPFIQNCFGHGSGNCPANPGKGWAGEGDHPIEANIYSNAGYDSLHPAGTSLNDLFEIFSMVCVGGPNQPYTYHYEIVSFASQAERRKSLYRVCMFRLISMPTISTTHTFSIVVNFTSGRVLTSSSAAIQLTP